MCVCVCVYTRVSQKFCNITAFLNAFAEVIKVINHSGLWNVKLSWYSSSATHQILPLGIGSRSLNLQFLAYLTLPDRWGSYNYLVIVHRSTAFSPFSQQMILIVYVALWFRSNICTIRSSLIWLRYAFIWCSFQITHGVKQCTTYQRTS